MSVEFLHYFILLVWYRDLIFAYGLDDPDMSSPEGIISYHGDRRGSRILALRSYGNPPPEEKFAGLDYFDFRSENVNNSIFDHGRILRSHCT